MLSLYALLCVAPLAMSVLHSLSAVTTIACSSLQHQLGATIVQTSSGPEYLNATSDRWDWFNGIQRPACVVFPEKASDVQAAMTTIFNHDISYAVRAGGHSAMKGWNNVQHGILIEFSHMQGVSFDITDNSITLQPGIRWGEALTALEPFGVAPLGGRVSDVGTGLLLGGGLSFLSAEYGFSVDALLEADVVLVNGTIVTATATNRFSDLFGALKGGGNRFGIVTRYKVTAIHIIEMAV